MTDKSRVTPVAAAALLDAPVLHGRVVEARGVIARVVGASLRIGEKVRLIRLDTREEQTGEVIGFAPDGALVMPFAELAGLSDITRVEVERCGLTWERLDGNTLGGRILSGLDDAPDGRPQPVADTSASAKAWRHALAPINPLERPVISRPFVTGV